MVKLFIRIIIFHVNGTISSKLESGSFIDIGKNFKRDSYKSILLLKYFPVSSWTKQLKK